MKYKEEFIPSPWHGSFLQPKGIVLHHSCGTWEGDISWITERTNNSQVSYHCLIAPDGKRVKFVPYNRIAWHAGVSGFKRKSHCNLFMLGLAFTGDTYKRILSTQEIESAVEWIRERMDEFKITLDWITTHRYISPGRKDDPSPEAEKAIIDALKKEL